MGILKFIKNQMKFKALANKKRAPSKGAKPPLRPPSNQGSFQLPKGELLPQNVARGRIYLEKNRVSTMRDLSMKKDNWNMFVGDPRYKTNFLLQFLDNSVKILYERHNIYSSLYSDRCLLVFIYVVMLIWFSGTTELEGPTSFSFLQALFATIVASASCILGTTNYLQDDKYLNSIKVKQVLILLLPVQMSFRVIANLESQGNPYVVASLLFLPTYIMSQYLLADWLDYLKFSLGHMLIFFFIQPTSLYAYSVPTLYVLALYIFAFACQEKVRKEQYIISHTNAKTKKVLLGLLNQVPHPIAIVNAPKAGPQQALSLNNAPGQISYCNLQFERLLSERLGLTSLPSNILRLTKEDEESTNRLRNSLDSGNQRKISNIEQSPLPSRRKSLLGGQTLRQMNQLSPFSSVVQGTYTDNLKQIEIKLCKASKNSMQVSPILASNNMMRKDTSPRLQEDSKSNHSTVSAITDSKNAKDVFDKFEIAEVQTENVTYGHQKSIMLTFDLVSEQKAKSQLLYANSQTVYKNVLQFNKRLQQIHFQYDKGEDPLASQNQQCIIEFLGTTYLILNKIQQIMFEFQEESIPVPNIGQSGSVSQPCEDNFLLKEEIMQCLESLSAKCLGQSAQIKLDTKCLPDRLSGDVPKFRLALHCVVEFALNYCKEGIIDVVVNFAGMTQKGQYEISFDFKFNRNRQINEEPLIRLLNSLQISVDNGMSQKQKIEELLLRNYDEFFNLIQHFGMGMIIFPKLVSDLGGSYSIKCSNSDGYHDSSQDLIFNSPAPPSIRERGDQDQAPNIAVSTPESPNFNVGGEIKISFKLPFEHAEMTKKLLNPYFPFNPNKEEIVGGKQIFKSPMLKARQNNLQIINEMKRMMEEKKQPSHSVQRPGMMGGPFTNNQSAFQNMQISVSPLDDKETSMNMQMLAQKRKSRRHPIPISIQELKVNSTRERILSSNFNSDNQAQNSPQLLESKDKGHKSDDLLGSSSSKKKSNKAFNFQQKPQMSTQLEQHRGTGDQESFSLMNSLNVVDQQRRSSIRSTAGENKNQKSQSKQIKGQEGLIKKVENTLKKYDIMNGGMNGTEFFKSQKLSQGGLNSNHGSPMGSGDKTMNVLNKDSLNLSDLHHASVEQESGTDSFGRQSKPRKDSNFQRIMGQFTPKANNSVDLNEFSSEISGKFPERVNSAELGRVSNSNDAQNGSSMQKSQSGFFPNSRPTHAATMKEDKRFSTKQLLLDNGTRKASLFMKDRTTKNVDSSDRRKQHDFEERKQSFSMMVMKKNDIDGFSKDSLPSKEDRQESYNSTSSFSSESLDYTQKNGEKSPMYQNNSSLMVVAEGQVPDGNHMLVPRSSLSRKREEGVKKMSSNNVRDVVSFGDINRRMLSDKYNSNERDLKKSHTSAVSSLINQNSSILNGQPDYQKKKSDIFHGSRVLLAVNSFTDKEIERRNSSRFDPYNIEDSEEEKQEGFDQIELVNEDILQAMPLSAQINCLYQDTLSSSGFGATKNLSTFSPNSFRFSATGGLKNYHMPTGFFRNGEAQTPDPKRRLVTESNVKEEIGYFSQTLALGKWFAGGLGFGNKEESNAQRLTTQMEDPFNFTSHKPAKRNVAVFGKQASRKPSDFHQMNKVNQKSELQRGRHQNGKKLKELVEEANFPYKKSAQTRRYEKEILEFDQQGDLVIWDRELQERLDAEKQIIGGSLANLGSHMRLLPSGTMMDFRCASIIDINKRYILVVEDNPMISEILVQTLKEFGLEAIVAENGKIAVDKFTNFMREGVLFEMILMDIIMPEMGGYESTQLIRKVEKDNAIDENVGQHFICGFSAQVNPDIAKKCHACGMDQILSKPISPETLKEMIDKNRRPTNYFVPSAENAISSKNFGEGMQRKASKFRYAD